MECYGHYGSTENKNCGECEFAESCRYYTTAPTDLARSGDVSLDSGSYNRDSHEDVQKLQTGLSKTTLAMQDIADFVRFLAELDDFTLGIVTEVVKGARSIAELAEVAGLSRWYVHKKVLTAISRVPELAELFVPLMPRLSAARRRFLLGGKSHRRGSNQQANNKETRNE